MSRNVSDAILNHIAACGSFYLDIDRNRGGDSAILACSSVNDVDRAIAMEREPHVKVYAYTASAKAAIAGLSQADASDGPALLSLEDLQHLRSAFVSKAESQLLP